MFVDQANIDSGLLKATTNYNEFHIDYQVNQLLKEDKEEYVIENICYKEDSKIPIIEESATLKIAKYLALKNEPILVKTRKSTN